MLFPVFIFRDKSSDFGVVVPGLPGCFSSGRTMEDALINSREAIELHVDGLVEDGLDIPEQGEVDDYTSEIKAGGVAALVEVDISAYEKKQSERVNVTFPSALLKKIDKESERLGTTRSGFLQRAAKSLIGEGIGKVTGKAKAVKKVAGIKIAAKKSALKPAIKIASAKTTQSKKKQKTSKNNRTANVG